MSKEPMHHLVDGKKVYCTPEEEMKIRREWAQNDLLIASRLKKDEELRRLERKYGHIPSFLDKLCRHLNIDPQDLK